MRPVAQQAQGPSVERVLVQQLGMVVPERSAHQEDTEGELSSLIRWHVTSVYWLDRIMRALIEGFGSGNRLGQTGKVGCPAGGLTAGERCSVDRVLPVGRSGFLSEVTPAPGAANAKRQPFFGFRPLELIVAAVVLAQDEIASLFFFLYTSTRGGPVHRARHTPTDSRAKSSSATATGWLRSCGAGSDAVSLLWLPQKGGQQT